MNVFSNITISILLMFAMLTQVLASGLSCVHHSNIHQHQNQQNHQPMMTLQTEQHHALNSQSNSQSNYHSHTHTTVAVNSDIEGCHIENLAMSSLHSASSGLQMNADDCHCTTFVAFELMPLAPAVESLNELGSQATPFYQNRPASGFLTSIYRPPLNA